MTTDINSTKVITGKVRLSFVHLLKPHAMTPGAPEKYSTMILIPKSDKATVTKIKQAIKVAYEAEKGGKLKGVKFEALKTNLRDGDVEMDTEERPEFAGMYFMNISSATAPTVLDRYKNKIDSQDEVYSGVYARVSMNAFAYNSNGNKGVSFGLNHVQVVAKGDYLGGKSSADADFDEWDEEEDEDDLI